MTYGWHVLILVGIYLLLASSLQLVAGYAGLFSLSHAAFYGIGAYTTALLGVSGVSEFPASVCASFVLGYVVGIAVGWFTVRIRDDYFAIATFAFNLVVLSVLNNCVSVTGGPMGVAGIPAPRVFGVEASGLGAMLALVYSVAFLSLLLCYRIARSPYGRVLRGVREDEVFVLSQGRNVRYYKVTVFATGAAVAAVAGCLYAFYVKFVDPTSFSVGESVFLLSIVIIGGLGSFWGGVVGAAVGVVVPEALRFLGLPVAQVGNLREIIYGIALILMMLARPQGLVGRFRLDVE